jgi:FkbH-like protein
MTSINRDYIERTLREGDKYSARVMMRRVLRESSSLSTAQFILRSLEGLDQDRRFEFRLAFLRSFTLEPVIPLLKATAALEGVKLSVRLSDFNSYSQEILDPASKLYRFDPDAVVLAVQTRDLVPDLWNRFSELSESVVAAIVEEAQASVANLILSFRARHRAHLIVHNLEIPSFTASGVLDAQVETSQVEAIRRINQGLTRTALQTPGVYVLDYDALVCRYGRLRWHDEQKWLSARMPIAADCLGHLASEYIRFLVPLAGKSCKALVVDLDNTLWGGIIGEEGLTGIKIGPDYPGAAFVDLQRAILDLYHRGILLAVCSKNNSGDAMEALEKHPHMLLRPHHFSALRINWNDKARNLREIAADLNIGVDALAFLDDNPQERERVGRELPEVYVIDLSGNPVEFADVLRQCPVFERLSLSIEDRERPSYYVQERQRKSLEEQAGSLEDFYRSLQMEVEIAQVDPDSLARVAQLTQKTNQFNLTTGRYTEQQIAELMGNPDWRVYSLRAFDKFGDSGVVGVAMTQMSGEATEIVNFLISCRVIGRTIETAFLAYLAEEAVQRGFRRLRGWFLPTRKNAPCRDFYRSHGFTAVSTEPNGEALWEFDLHGGRIDCPPWIRRSIKAHVY